MGTCLIGVAGGVHRSRPWHRTVPSYLTTLIICHVLFQTPSMSEFFSLVFMASLWEHFTLTPPRKFEFLDFQRRFYFFKNIVMLFPTSWFMSLLLLLFCIVAFLHCDPLHFPSLPPPQRPMGQQVQMLQIVQIPA